jgi:integrase
MAEVLLNQADPVQAAHGWQPPAQVQLPSPLPIGSAPEDRPPLNPVSAPVQTASVEGDQSITRWTEKTIQNKAGSWNEKTGKQALQIGKLFERFMTEEFSFSTLGPLRQPHLARFSEFLRHEIYKHTGKRDADFTMTIAELRDYALTKPPKMRGVSNATLNRHLNSLKQIFDYAESQGFELDSKISTKKLRQSTKDRRGRDERKPFTPAEIKIIFRQPVFAGCRGWRNADLLLPGKDIYHRALFFVPIICFYSGARREEVCAAGVDDVIIDNGPIPYLRLEPNAFRGLKNRQSTRNIPLHPELIRLGFLDYVRAIKALRYVLLFPDLHSPSNSAPLGDKLGDDLRKVLNAAGITEKGKLLQSHRHGFGNTLKQKGVTVEGRADLLGHGGDTETAERYCEAFEIAAKFEMIEKLPPVTAHLPTSSIRLLPKEPVSA